MTNREGQLLNFTNFLLIGYAAWRGFLKLGRGVVICNINGVRNNAVNLPHAPFSAVRSKYDYTDEIVSTHFLAKKDLEAYLREWIIPVEAVSNILQAVDSYNPQLDLILLIKNGEQIEVDILQKPVITPLECYQQVRRRQDEFFDYIS